MSLAIVAVALAGAFVIFQHADPNDAGKFWPRCMLHEATGWHCPGCGSTRALHALSHGDIRTAMVKNGLLVIALPLLALAGIRQVWNGLFPQKAWWPDFRMPSWAILSIAATTLLYTILRNLPAFEFLAPQ